MSVNSKMAALADEIRELSGTTAKIGLDDMTTHVANANTEIDDQATLLEQAIAALEGKAAGSGGAVETCTFSATYSYLYTLYYVNESGECIEASFEGGSGNLTVRKNSIVMFVNNYGVSGHSVTGGVTIFHGESWSPEGIVGLYISGDGTFKTYMD